MYIRVCASSRTRARVCRFRTIVSEPSGRGGFRTRARTHGSYRLYRSIFRLGRTVEVLRFSYDFSKFPFNKQVFSATQNEPDSFFVHGVVDEQSNHNYYHRIHYHVIATFCNCSWIRVPTNNIRITKQYEYNGTVRRKNFRNLITRTSS